MVMRLPLFAIMVVLNREEKISYLIEEYSHLITSPIYRWIEINKYIKLVKTHTPVLYYLYKNILDDFSDILVRS
jgi:hypothetical protein